MGKTNNIPNELFQNTLNYIEKRQIVLRGQLIAGFVFVILLLLSFCIFVKVYPSLVLTNNNNVLHEVPARVIFIVGSIFMSSLAVAIYFLLKINTYYSSLTDKYIALSTFSDIQKLLNNGAGEPSFEYKVSIKTLLETINNLAQNSKVS